jgi:hypothetical protein
VHKPTSALVYNVHVTLSYILFKLLWHLLKSHRTNLSDFTEASLIDWITCTDDTSVSSLSNVDCVLSNMNTMWKSRPRALSFNFYWTTSILAEGSSYAGKQLRNPLAIGTILRLLRFLNDGYKDKWVSIFLDLTKSSRKCVSMLTTLPEWQPCLFHLISDCLESIHFINHAQDDNSNNHVTISPTLKRLDLCLQLYSTLLGHLLRSGGDKVSS